MNKLKFIDLFAGIGGFHLALHSLGATCVFASEIDPFARKTYEVNFAQHAPALFKNGRFNSDITKINDYAAEIPDFDLLCAGFPCQPFSQAGFKRGFAEAKDQRGNMFFTIANIIHAKQPKAIFLENVRHLENHDEGRTFAKIKDVIVRDLGYSFYHQIVRASDYGLPQHRPRIYMVGFRNDVDVAGFTFPAKQPLKMTMDDVFGGRCEKKIGYTLRVGGKGSGVHDRRNWDCYIVDGKARRLRSDEGKKMMGFPANFVFPVSETQALKQLGNSVAVNAVTATAEAIINHLAKSKKVRQQAKAA